MTGCDALPFTPQIDVSPQEHTASTPTGLNVEVKVPQTTTLEANALAEADVRETTVTLPAGMQLSPGAANGLQACSEQQIGYMGMNEKTQAQEFTATKPSCPEASKVGLVDIKTPLLPHELKGAVYLATPAPNAEAGKNPFGSLLSLYLVAEDPVSGVLVKLAGKGELNENTLRVATTFSNTPQVPFEDLTLDLFGGAKGSLGAPRALRSVRHRSEVHALVGHGNRRSELLARRITGSTSGVNGDACPGAQLPFAPGVPGAEHQPGRRRVHRLSAEALPSRRRPGAERDLDAPTAGDRGVALERDPVL